MEEIRDIIGDTVSDKRMADTIMDNHYDLQKSLDILLNEPAPKSKPKQLDHSEKGNYPVESIKTNFRY
jgi:hypothetical protein